MAPAASSGFVVRLERIYPKRLPTAEAGLAGIAADKLLNCFKIAFGKRRRKLFRERRRLGDVAHDADSQHAAQKGDKSSKLFS